MPRFRAIERQVSAPGAVQRRQATSADFGGDRGLTNFGAQVTDAANIYQRHRERQEAFDADNVVAQETVDVDVFSRQLQKDTTLDEAQGFAERGHKALEDRRAGLLKDFKGGAAARQRLAHGLQRVHDGQQQRYHGVEAQLQGQRRVRDLGQTLERFNNHLYLNPERVKNQVQEYHSLVDETPDLMPEVKGKLKAEAKSNLYASSLNGLVSGVITDPETTADDIEAVLAALKEDDNLYQKGAESRDYIRAIERLTSAHKTKKRADEWEFKNAFNEWATKALFTEEDDGTFTKASIARALSEDPQSAYRMTKQLEITQHKIQASHEVRGRPFDEVAKELDPRDIQERVRSLPADRAQIEIEKFQAKEAVFQRNLKTFIRDPAGFMVQNNETVRLSNQQVQEAIEGLTDDPETHERVVETLDAYVANMTSQVELMSPGADVPILTRQQAAAVAAQLERVSTAPEGATRMLDLLSGQRAIYGKHWPAVVRDLFKHDAIDHTQAVAASMLDRPELRTLTRQMLVAAVTPTKELTDYVGSSEYQDFRTAAAAELAPFFASMGDTTQGTQTKNAYTEAIAKTTAHLATMGIKMRPQDIAQKVVGDKYEFVGNVRIPRAEGIDTRYVADAQHRMLSGEFLAGRNLVSPAGDLFPEDIKRRHIRSLSTFGNFITRTDDSGAEMVDQWGDPVMEIVDGKQQPLFLKWGELEAMGREFRRLGADHGPEAFQIEALRRRRP